MQQEMNWREMLKDSSWVTVAWDWFQTLLSRTVDFVLWVTMIFSCYQLIPGVTQLPVGVSTAMFVSQFVALDIGGIGLNRLAQRQGLARWSYTRVVAYTLIGITLVTITYSGMQRVLPIPASFTAGIEVTLVICRSVMTVMYGQAIHGLKDHATSTREELEELQATVQRLTNELQAMGEGHAQELRAMVASYASEKLAMAKGYDDRLAGELRVAGQRHAEEVRVASEQYAEALRLVIERHGEELVSVNGRHTEALQATVTACESEKSAMAMSYQRQIDGLLDRLRSGEGQPDEAMEQKRSLTVRAKDSLPAEGKLLRVDFGRSTGYVDEATQNESEGYVAADDGTTIAISNGSGQTMIATGSHRDRIKQAMLQAVKEQREINYKDIADVANVGYSTVKKHALGIRRELGLVDDGQVESDGQTHVSVVRE